MTVWMGGPAVISAEVRGHSLRELVEVSEMPERVLLTSTLCDLLIRRYVIHRISWWSRWRWVECFSARMCGCKALMQRRILQTAVWMWCRVFQLVGTVSMIFFFFGLIDSSACTVWELERVHQWVS